MKAINRRIRTSQGVLLIFLVNFAFITNCEKSTNNVASRNGSFNRPNCSAPRQVAMTMVRTSKLCKPMTFSTISPLVLANLSLFLPVSIYATFCRVTVSLFISRLLKYGSKKPNGLHRPRLPHFEYLFSRNRHMQTIVYPHAAGDFGNQKAIDLHSHD